MIDRICLYQYKIPLRYALPLKGSILTERQGTIVELKSGDRYGYGEAAPLADFSHETAEEAWQQLEREAVRLINVSGGSPVLSGSLYPSVAFAVSSALWMLEHVHRLSAPENAPLLQGDTVDILQRLSRWSSSWPDECKLKIGKGSVDADVQRIRQVAKQLPEVVKLRLDANQRWTLQQALRIGERLSADRIAYIEEPTSDWSEFTAIFQATGIPFALDETVQKPDYTYQKLDGLAAMIIKPTLVGDVNRCRALLQAGQSDGVRTVFSSTFESDVGIYILQQLSARYVPFEQPGLDTASAFSCPLVTDFHQPGQQWSFNSDHLLSRQCFYS